MRTTHLLGGEGRGISMLDLRRECDALLLCIDSLFDFITVSFSGLTLRSRGMDTFDSSLLIYTTLIFLGFWGLRWGGSKSEELSSDSLVSPSRCLSDLLVLGVRASVTVVRGDCDRFGGLLRTRPESSFTDDLLRRRCSISPEPSWCSFLLLRLWLDSDFSEGSVVRDSEFIFGFADPKLVVLPSDLSSSLSPLILRCPEPSGSWGCCVTPSLPLDL